MGENIITTSKGNLLGGGAMRSWTTSEVAYLAEVSTEAVQRAVDRGEVGRTRPGRQRTLGLPEVLYLRMRSELVGVLVREARQEVYRSLQEDLEASETLQGLRETIEVGPVRIDSAPAAEAVSARLSRLAEARAMVVEDPEIFGGEPVVVGTRIPVYSLLALVEQGASAEELLEDFPALDSDRLELALVYARAYPRRGRPPESPPWHR
jgi:uncharacterized protein (DUF433 family)